MYGCGGLCIALGPMYSCGGVSMAGEAFVLLWRVKYGYEGVCMAVKGYV